MRTHQGKLRGLVITLSISAKHFFKKTSWSSGSWVWQLPAENPHFSWLHPRSHSINHLYKSDFERTSSAKLTQLWFGSFFMTPVQCKISSQRADGQSFSSLLFPLVNDSEVPVVRDTFSSLGWMDLECATPLPRENHGTGFGNANLQPDWATPDHLSALKAPPTAKATSKTRDVALMRLNSPDLHDVLFSWSRGP